MLPPRYGYQPAKGGGGELHRKDADSCRAAPRGAGGVDTVRGLSGSVRGVLPAVPPCPFPFPGCGRDDAAEKGGQASRLISTGQLKPLPVLHFRPIDPVVYREPSDPAEAGKGDLIFGGAWRLDAFSAYPFAA